MLVLALTARNQIHISVHGTPVVLSLVDVRDHGHKARIGIEGPPCVKITRSDAGGVDKYQPGHPSNPFDPMQDESILHGLLRAATDQLSDVRWLQGWTIAFWWDGVAEPFSCVRDRESIVWGPEYPEEGVVIYRASLQSQEKSHAS